MADIKISQLGAAVAVADADVIPATANGVTVKVPASVLKEYAIGGTDISSIGDGTPTGAISALKSVKIEKTDIAPIETSVTSKAYAVGDQLYYNGMLYSAIAAIAQGETLVVDTNIELSDKVTEQIKALQGSVDLVNADLQKEVTTRAELGTHNLLDVSSGTVSNCSLANNGFTNTNSDARDFFNFVLKALDSSSTLISAMANQSITNAGEYSFDITIPANTAYILVQHVGSTRNIQISVPSSLEAGNYTFSFKVQSANPTTVGGLDVRNIMLRLSTDTDTTYQPYAMTNRELTENKAEKDDLTDIKIKGSVNNTGGYIYTRQIFYFNGVLVMATQDIANGATITLGTNCNVFNRGVLNGIKDALIYGLFRFYFGTETLINNLSNGFWIISTASARLMTDLPSDYTAGRIYVLQAKYDDDYFTLIFVPNLNAAYLRSCYSSIKNWVKLTP